MGRKVYIIGIGPGSRELMHPQALKLIGESDVLIGGRRNLEVFEDTDKERIEIGSELEEISKYIAENSGSKRISVLVTGDPGIYSLQGFLKEKLPDVELEAVPGISSMQYLCSKRNLNWNDMVITSLHGRREELADVIRNNPKVAVFTGGKIRPEHVCRMLLENNIKDAFVTVGENLSYANERIVTGTPEEISSMSFDSLSVMIIQNRLKKGMDERLWSNVFSSIPDNMFVRGDVPMTKEEIRSISLSKLRLKEDSLVYDIGAGTGSVSIECALRCAKGRVYAVEAKDEALELINRNMEEFEIYNMEIIRGKAPEVLKGRQAPDRVFIGGSSGFMEELLRWVKSFDGYIRVVINTVTIESTYEALSSLDKLGFEDVEVVNAAICRSMTAGKKHLMQAMNPVYIISADKN